MRVAQQHNGRRPVGVHRLDEVFKVTVRVATEEDPVHDCWLNQAPRKARASTPAWCRRG
jgi:hypothetical protein